jgi:hypothetical protein
MCHHLYTRSQIEDKLLNSYARHIHTKIGHKEAAYALELMSVQEIQGSTQKYVKAFLNPELHVIVTIHLYRVLKIGYLPGQLSL